ncbi:cytochrome P450 [Streptomyces formicae]
MSGLVPVCPAAGKQGRARTYLAGAEMAERFFGAEDHELSHAGGWDLIFGEWFGHGLLNLDGARHRAYRQALMPLLRRSAVTAHQDTVTGILTRAVRTLPEGTPVDLHPFTQDVAFTVAARLFAGMDQDEARELRSLFGVLRTPAVGRLGTPEGNRGARAVARARRRMRELLRTCVLRLGEADGPVRRLRALPDPPPDDVIAENITILILAGYETTGYLSARLLWLLARHPREQENLRNEGADPGAAPLLEAAFTETARLHPPLAWLPRTAPAGIDLGTATLTPGSEVFFSVTATQRDARTFTDPDAFRPRRFEEGERHGRFALTPFGAGRRICPGIHLGTLESKLIVAAVLRAFRLTAPVGPYIKDISRNGSTVTPAAPLAVRLDRIPGRS